MLLMKKNKKYLILGVEFIVLVVLVQYSLTDGFTKTLGESLGVNGNGNIFDTLIGSPDIGKLLTASVALIIFFVTYLLLKNKKN